MRIRRYAKLAVAGVTAQTPATVSGASDTLVCQLNRSPWDVISFAAESHPKNIKEEEGEEGREEEMADNGRISPKNMKLAREWKDENHEKDEILCRKTGSKGWKCRKEAKQGYSLCEHHLELKRYSREMSRRKSDKVAGECRRRRENMVEVKEDKLAEVKEVKLVELKEEKDENGKKEDDQNGEKAKNLCRKSGSKGWKCRREAKEGHTLCEHHLSLKCYYRQESCQKSEAAATGKCRRSCNRKLLSSTTSEFYFYSGFGPRWRRRRGSESGDEASIPPPPPPPPPSSSSPPSPPFMDAHEHAHLDHHDHNDNKEEEEKRVDCKKRKRKPMKARSLKSIL